MTQTGAIDAGDQGVWTERFRVRSYEADARGIATPASVCNYFQEAAGNHAFSLKVSVEQLQERNLTWMLSRLRLQVDRLPRWREDVDVETWPSGASGIFAIRHFVLRSGREELARAATAWLLIDLARRRPVRLTDEILQLASPDRPVPLPFTNDRVPAPQNPVTEDTVSVRWSDMDVNEHTNNVRYVAWAMDALPEAVHQRVALAALSVDFLGETRPSEVLMVRSAPSQSGDQMRFLTELVKEADDRPVARLESSWRGA